ncbi:MAG: MerR family transcriptional regulator [Chlorobi bacterium]|nr:MerR family transcriptional regulator [Chlorobiota bacterium]
MQKLYSSISEVCKLIDEEQHILRYWEKEFDKLRPKKNRSGNRIYSNRDIYIIKTIKSLLRSDKIPLKDAKKKIKEMSLKPGDEKINNEIAELESVSMMKSAAAAVPVMPKPAKSAVNNSESIDILRKVLDYLKK